MSPTTKSETAPLYTIDTLKNLQLDKFCVKKLFQIELTIPLTSKDDDFLKQIVETGKKYEYLSDVRFITYEDVLDLIERLATNSSNVDLPKNVTSCAHQVLLEVLQEINFLKLDFLALMTKLKIIESMYTVYKSEVSNMQRRQHVHRELNELLKNCETKEKGDKKGKKNKKGKKGKSKKGDKSSKKSKKSSKKSKKSDKKSKKSSKSKKSKKSKSSDKHVDQPEVVVDDYTEIILEENEVIFDYNVDNHLMYFVLNGFVNPLLLQELSNIKVEVSAIIDVALESSNFEHPDDVIMQLQEMFETPKDNEYLESTVWMKYRSDGKSPIKEVLEEFLYVVKKINYIKRQHLSYIKDLKLINLGITNKKLDLDCLEKYCRIMDSYPLELVNIPLVVDALVEEICWRELGPIYSLSDLTPSSESENIVRKEPKSFQAHEEDLLKMGIKAFREPGRKCYDKSLCSMKLLQPFSKIDTSPKRSFQNRAVSTEDTCLCNNLEELFDYFHVAIFSQMRRKEFVPREPQDYSFTSKLVTHDEVKHYQKALPKGDSGNVKTENNDVINNYHMKEDLSSGILRQLIFKTMKNYSCLDRAYCQDSRSILLRFHDNLNEFGIDTKIWWQNLRTPVCLRDFCRYVSNEEKTWLEEHKLEEHADLNDDSDEECEGLRDIHVPELYQEYQYLLGTISGVSREEKKQLFDGAWSELVNYPKSGSLVDYCNEQGTLAAYDLGPKLCQLTGHTTIFHSDDGVKITIDTSRFMVEDPKCTITVDAEENSLVFHNHRSSAFHVILKDETILSFREFDHATEIPIISATEERSYHSIGEQEEEKLEKPKPPNYNDYWIEVLRKSKITTAIPNFFKKTPITDMKVKLDERNLDRLLELFKAAVYVQHPIYKISTKPSIRYLKRTSSPLHLPFVSTLKRVLFKPPRKKRKIAGYSVLNIPTMIKDGILKYDFKITLPNGLTISTLPRNRQVAEIKQEYQFGRYNEQYRIFYASGVILIKKFDGSTVILRSNGDTIKLTDQSECYSVNCAQNTSYVFRDQEEENCPYQISRCLESQKEKIRTDFVNLYEFGDIPFTKKTLLEFEGKRINVSDDVVTEKQLYYVTSEPDYHAEEVFYEREDGMKCIVDKKGKRIFQFPDGTKITTWPEVEKELIHVTKNPKIEGWVSILVNYKFEHPDYITVMYDQTGRATEIFLKDTIIKNTQESFTMSTSKNIAFQISSNHLIFLKTCELCDCDCVCKIHLDEAPNLLEFCDSYNKYITCDHRGNCEINSSFIREARNKNNCNHRWMNEKQKMFILNERGPAGTLLWKDSTIEKKILETKQNKNMKLLNYMNKLIRKQTLEFYTEIYQSFIGRFTMTRLYKNDICLSKYKQTNDEKPTLCYVTYRVIIEFQNLSERPEIMAELGEYLENRASMVSSCLLQGIKQILRYVTENGNTSGDKLSYRVEMKEREDSVAGSSFSRSIDLDKLTVQDIIIKWRQECDRYKFLIRNKKFPPYFHSDYYQYVLNSITQT